MMCPIQVSMCFSDGLMSANESKSLQSNTRLQSAIHVRKVIFLKIIPFNPIEIP